MLVRQRIQEDKCPFCGADKLDVYYDNIEVEGREASQSVSCMNRERQFTEVYTFKGVILTDYPGDDVVVEFDWDL